MDLLFLDDKEMMYEAEGALDEMRRWMSQWTRRLAEIDMFLEGLTLEEKSAYAQLFSQLYGCEWLGAQTYAALAAVPSEAKYSDDEQAYWLHRAGEKLKRSRLLKEIIEMEQPPAEFHPQLVQFGNDVRNEGVLGKCLAVPFFLDSVVLPAIYERVAETTSISLFRETIRQFLEEENRSLEPVIPFLKERIQQAPGEERQKGRMLFDRWLPQLDQVISAQRDAAAYVGMDVDDIKAKVLQAFQKMSRKIRLI